MIGHGFMVTNLLVVLLIIYLGSALRGQELMGRKQYVVLISFILFLQSGLRNVAVGPDTYAYQNIFERVELMSWPQVWENIVDCYVYGIEKDPGYTVLQKIFQLIFPFYQMWLLAIAGFFFVSLGRFIYHNTRTNAEAMLGFVIYSCMFYSFYSITGHRQTIATACCLIGYELIVKKRLIFFLLIMSVASTIHKSCLIFIPFYFLVNFYHGKRYYWLAAVVIPLSFYFQTQILEFCQLWGYDDYAFYDAGGTPVFTFLLISIAIFVGVQLKVVRVERPEVDNYCKALICALLFTPLTWFNPSAMRIVQYFSFFLIVLIPVTISGMQPIPMRKVFFCVALICLPLLYANNSMSHSYRLWFQDMPLACHYQ